MPLQGIMYPIYLSLLVSLIFTTFSDRKNITKKENETRQENHYAQPDEWQRQFANNTLDGWSIFRNTDGAKTGWILEDGVLVYNSELAKGQGNKSLISDKLYENFEIRFEWKVSQNGNSGFMWGVSLDEKFQHPFESGPEIQILDPAVYFGDTANQTHTAGALYDLIPPNKLVTKVAGEWNSYHIVVNHNDNQVIVVHNDVEILRFPTHGPDWDQLVADSKFANIDGFGTYRKGHLSFQDHPGIISYRNVEIRELD